VVEVEQGAVVLRQGEAGDNIFVLLEGRTVALRHLGASEQVLGEHRVGDIIGEIVALTGRQRTATIVAEAPSRLLLLPAELLRVSGGAAPLRQRLGALVDQRLAMLGLIEPVGQ